MKPIILNDFMDKALVREMEDSLAGNTFPWFLQQGTFDKEGLDAKLAIRTPDTLDTPQLTHYFVRPGATMAPQHPVMSIPLALANARTDLRLNLVRRVKANLTLPSNHDGYYQMPHIDVTPDDLREPSITAIYYVNDADGDTVLFNQTYDGKRKKLTELMRVAPKRGSMLVFGSDRYHAGSNPVKSPYRIVVNFNLTLHSS